MSNLQYCLCDSSCKVAFKYIHYNLYAAPELNLQGNVLQEFQLLHHHSIRLVLLVPQLVSKAQLQ